MRQAPSPKNYNWFHFNNFEPQESIQLARFRLSDVGVGPRDRGLNGRPGLAVRYDQYGNVKNYINRFTFARRRVESRQKRNPINRKNAASARGDFESVFGFSSYRPDETFSLGTVGRKTVRRRRRITERSAGPNGIRVPYLSGRTGPIGRRYPRRISRRFTRAIPSKNKWFLRKFSSAANPCLASTRRYYSL